ncbi:hypothetical protein Ddye_030342 [Dipteronia dyeriana]|uniref:KNOX1 domain-containing protein n=1 Tax=Dipteronia dyeriana TaxID=168575 RepID=A0AAD9WMK6_9ROSI|nr:hypothetical protein Ddye_030342 [Dipteronia dyeriana]
MEAAKSIVENGKSREIENVRFEDDVDVDSEDDEENLKRRISSHPLYGLLIETHFNCLKVGLGEIDEAGTRHTENQANLNLQSTINPTCSELDRFMNHQLIDLPVHELESETQRIAQSEHSWPRTFLSSPFEVLPKKSPNALAFDP